MKAERPRCVSGRHGHSSVRDNWGEYVRALLDSVRGDGSTKCIKCRAEAEPPRMHCAECIKSMREECGRVFDERHAAGMCVYCGVRRRGEGFWCTECGVGAPYVGYGQ